MSSIFAQLFTRILCLVYLSVIQLDIMSSIFVSYSKGYYV